jgi:uncharacterized protein
MNNQSTSLAQFEKQQYLNVETYRKNGQAMPTPVWFAQEGDCLYVRTFAGAGKVKRIRNNPRVRVAPCDQRGKLKGDWVEAEARVVDAAEDERINALLKRKYGLIKWVFELFTGLRNKNHESIVIRLKGSPVI